MAYLIISPSHGFAVKLGCLLNTGTSNSSEEIVVEITTNPATLCKLIVLKVNSSTTIILDCHLLFPNKSAGTLPIQEVMLRLRCQYSLLNPIVVYGILPLNALLHKDPNLFILTSPGTHYIELPITKHRVRSIRACSPLIEKSLIRRYLMVTMQVALAGLRHTFANYAAMAMMLDVAKKVYAIEEDHQILKGQGAGIAEMRSSLAYAVYAAVYGIGSETLLDQADTDLLKIKTSKKILLVDDLASKGWSHIISQMIYGKPDAKEFIFIDLPVASDDKDWIDRAFQLVKDAIAEHQPHLILLDLRLRNEIGPMELDKLGGYQLLGKIKGTPSLQGIPVIMFTASTNVQHIKLLLKQGAVSVWTKPGIDERLGSKEVIWRYKELIRGVDDVLNYYRIDFYSALNSNIQKLGLMAFEQLRSKLLEHASFVNYRCLLQGAPSKSHFFTAYSDIFIDTNVLMTGIVDETGDDSVDFAETILNVFHLAKICGSRKQNFEVNGQSQQVSIPQLIIVNQVFDELMKLSKEVKGDPPTQGWKRALIGYDIIRSLFDGGHPIRTEYNQLDKQGNLSWKLLKPSDDHYADDPLRSYIKAIITGEQFTITQQKVKHQIKIQNPDANVLLICHENPKSKFAPEKKLPNLIKKDLQHVPNLDKKLTIIRLGEFNEIMKALPL